MPIRSGYQVKLSALQQEQLGLLPKKEEKDTGFNWIGFLRVLTTIAEIGLTLIPGVGPIAATGIAVGAAGVYTGLDVAQGSVSGLNLGLTWGAAIIPGLSQARTYGKAIGKVAGKFESVDAEFQALRELAKSGQRLSKEQASTLSTLMEQRRTLKTIRSELSPYSNFRKPQDITESLYQKSIAQSESQLRKSNAFLTETERIITEKTGEKFNFKDFARDMFEINRVNDRAAFIERSNWFKDLTGQPFSEVSREYLQISKAQTALSEQGLAITKQTLSESVQSSLGAARATVLGEAADDLQDDIRNFKKLSPEIATVEEELRRVFGNERIDDLIKDILNAPKAQQQSRAMAWIRENLGAEEAEKLILRVNNVANKSFKVTQNAPKGFIDKHIYALKHPFSSHFAEHWVQKLQLIDPNDIGRAPAEFIYKKLRKKFAKTFERAATIDKSLTKLEKMKEAFEKTGGTLVNSNRIIGYKVIHTVGVKTLIMITFNPAPSRSGGTGAVHRVWNGVMTKNYRGKDPVFVEATDVQLEMLREQGFSYYLDTWAYNHGGHAVGGAFFGMGGMLSGMTKLLPWINTTALRSWLSISSNWVENIADMARGEYGSQWVHKFLRSMKRTGISRGGRLLAQGFIRPIVGGKAGFFIGKEMQRILGATTTGLNNAMDKKQGSFSKRWVKSFTAELVPRGYELATSYTNRAGRARGAYGSQVRAAHRKLGFLRRPMSAVTPNSVLNPRSFTRFKV